MKFNQVAPVLVSVLAITLSSSALAAPSLKDDELGSISGSSGGGSAAGKQWFDRIDISGSLAAGFMYTTTARPTFQNGVFAVHEANIQFDAQAWENVNAVLSLFPVWWPANFSNSAGAFGELYVHFNNIFRARNGDSLLGIKIGRLDMAFGEEYLTQMYKDNPLITRGAAWWWGYDEGILLHGNLWKFGWILAAYNGYFQTQTDDSVSKTLTAKLTFKPIEALYFSANAMSTGQSKTNEWWQGFRHLSPVAGAGRYASGNFYEGDAKVTFGHWGHLAAEIGTASISDYVPDASHNLYWYLVEPLFNITSQFYLVGRYSWIGTGDTTTYPFNDGLETGANGTITSTGFGRLAGGIGFRANSNTTLKVEVSNDTFEGAAATVSNDRLFVGFQAVVKF